MRSIHRILFPLLFLAVVSVGHGASSKSVVKTKTAAPAERNAPKAAEADDATGQYAEARPVVALSEISYAVPASRWQTIRHQHLRQALLLCLQRSGFRVLHLRGIASEDLSFGYISPRRTFSTPGAEAAIHLEYQGKLQISFSNPELKAITVPEELEDFWPIACSAVSQLFPEAKLAWTAGASVNKLPAEIASSKRFNWPTAERLKRINQLLAVVDGNKQDTATLGELAALFAGHATYYCRIQEESCFAYYGKALLMAELADASGAAWGKKLRGEVSQIARRYGAGLKLVPDSEPLLPEMAAAIVMETTDTGAVDSLFSSLLAEEAGGASLAFVDQCQPPQVLDLGLLSAKPDLDGWGFGEVQFLLTNIGSCFKAFSIEAKLLLPPEEAGIFEARVKELLEKMKKNPETLVATKGALVTGRLQQFGKTGVDGIVIESVLEHIEACVRKYEAEPDGSAVLQIGEMGPEMRDQLVLLQHGLRERYIKLGWGQSEKEYDFLLRCYGLAKIRVAAFQRFTTVIFQDDIQDWNALRGQFAIAIRNPDRVTETFHIWSKLDPKVRAWLAAQPESSEPAADLAPTVVAAFNRLLDDRTLFDPEIFSALPKNVVTDEERTRWEAVSLPRVREINRILLETVLEPWLARADYGYRPPRSSTALQVVRHEEALEHCRQGDFTAALKMIEPDLNVRAGDGNYTSLYQECLLRTGQLKKLADYAALMSDFAQEDFRFTLLRWFTPEDLKAEAASFQEGTHSARDYVTRSEYALRTGDYEAAKKAAQDYHYSPTPHQTLFLEMGEILTGKASEDSHWQALEGALQSQLGNWNVGQVDAVVRTLDVQAKDHTSWTGLKARLRLDDWVFLSEADKVRRGPRRFERLKETFNRLDQLTGKLEANPQDMKLALYRYAVFLQHDVLAQLLIESARAGVPFEEGLILSTMRKSRQSKIFQVNVQQHLPDEAGFLGFMVRHGATSEMFEKLVSDYPGMVAALKLGPREFREALAFPKFLSFVLHEAVDDRTPELSSRCWFRSLRRKLLCSTATARGFHAYAITCGLPLVRETKDISVLLPYLHGPQGQEWIARNAPDARTAERWLAQLEASKPPGDVPGLAVADLIERVSAE